MFHIIYSTAYALKSSMIVAYHCGAGVIRDPKPPVLYCKYDTVPISHVIYNPSYIAQDIANHHIVSCANGRPRRVWGGDYRSKVQLKYIE